MHTKNLTSFIALLILTVFSSYTKIQLPENEIELLAKNSKIRSRCMKSPDARSCLQLKLMLYCAFHMTNQNEFEKVDSLIAKKICDKCDFRQFGSVIREIGQSLAFTPGLSNSELHKEIKELHNILCALDGNKHPSCKCSEENTKNQ